MDLFECVPYKSTICTFIFVQGKQLDCLGYCCWMANRQSCCASLSFLFSRWNCTFTSDSPRPIFFYIKIFM